MNNPPILCSGNDLARICADLERRGFVPWAVDASVKTNAGYRVSYFEQVAQLADATVDEEKRLAVATTDRAIGVRLPSCSPNVAGRTSLISKVTGKLERERQMEETPPETVNPSILNAGKEPVIPADKSPEGSDQVTPEEITCRMPQSGVGRQTESRVKDCHQHSDSIETRLVALQSKLAAEGKLRRSKSARLPYRDL